MVRISVTSATEGAAPNSPAKLLGLRTSPRTAKAETNRPPIMKRMEVSIMVHFKAMAAPLNSSQGEARQHAGSDRQHDGGRGPSEDRLRPREFQAASDGWVGRHQHDENHDRPGAQAIDHRAPEKSFN